MSTVQPFGQLESAAILAIGHDPRLQHSQTKAEFAWGDGSVSAADYCEASWLQLAF